MIQAPNDSKKKWLSSDARDTKNGSTNEDCLWRKAFFEIIQGHGQRVEDTNKFGLFLQREHFCYYCETGKDGFSDSFHIASLIFCNY